MVKHTLKTSITIGRFILALAFVAFGIQHLAYALTASGLGPPWTPVSQVTAIVTGICLIGISLCFFIRRQVNSAALLLSVVLIARAVLNNVPPLLATPRNPGPWTSMFELLAIAGASLVLASTASAKDVHPPATTLSQSGRILFSASLLVFAIQHFMYARFIAQLIPVWIPGHLFCSYFVGVAFAASALAIVSGKQRRLAANLLGVMFLLWVLILHGPRVANALHNGNEWSSLFVALAMSGSAFVVANVSSASD